MFVFEYFTGHLLRLAQNDLPLQVTKRILKDALRGLAELHNRDIVHTGMYCLLQTREPRLILGRYHGR